MAKAEVTPGNQGSSEGLITPSGITLEETTYDDTTFVAPTWEEMSVFTRDLARKINASGEDFDLIVPLGNGGLTWVRILADRIKVDNIVPIRIKRYDGVNSGRDPEIIIPLYRRIDGKRVLLLDEVIDEGPTILAGRDHLLEKGAVEGDLRIATLCFKPHAREKTGVEPDYHVFETNDWVVFPHEPREFIEEKALKWLHEGLSLLDVKGRLLKIGLDNEDVEEYVNPFQ